MITMQYSDGGMSIHLANAPQVTSLMLQTLITDSLVHLHMAAARNMAGELIDRRTGHLINALMEQPIQVTGDGVTGELIVDSSKAPYGEIQEDGGTIVPKTAKALAIPLAAMLTGNGVARGTAQQVKDDPTAFGFVATFIPKGHSVIMGKLPGKTGSIVPLFALAASVTLPGRHYLDITLRQELGWMADRLETLAQESVTVLFGGES